MALHNNLTGAFVHTPFRAIYANSSARTSETGFASADVNKIVLQSDNSTLWLVTSVTSGAPAWTALGGSGAAGGVTYIGTWNATSNSPALVSSTGVAGDYYIVSTAGTTALDGITSWAVGDWAIFNGSLWERLSGTDPAVVSVAGRTGVITLASADISYDDSTTGLGTANVQDTFEKIAGVLQALSAVTGGLLAGGTVTWVSGYTYNISAGVAYINGALVSWTSQNVTLTAADGTFDRIDVIGVDNTGTAFFITGTPAAAPAEPSIDPTTQLQLDFATVATGTTSPPDVTVTDIYQEGTIGEWDTIVTNGGTFNGTSTNSPYTGTHDIEATAAVSNNSIRLQASASLALSNQHALTLWIKSKAAWAPTTYLEVFFAHNNTRIGNSLRIQSGAAFDSTNTSSYQLISFQISGFATAATLVNQLKFLVHSTAGSIGFYIDDIQLQYGGTGGGITTPASLATLSDVLLTSPVSGDALIYNGTSWVNLVGLLASNNLSDLASASTARTNLGLGTAATHDTTDFDAAGAASTAQTNAATSAASLYVPVTSVAAASGVASLNSSTQVPVAQLSTMVASGGSHAAGIVPDPGSSSGSTKFLREDATWVVPASGSTLAITTATITTGSIADSVADNTQTLASGRSGSIYKISANASCYVRVYASAADQTADTRTALPSSTMYIPPSSGGSTIPGLLLEFWLAPGNLSVDLPASPSFCNLDGSVASHVNISCTNTSGTTQAITVTFTIETRVS